MIKLPLALTTALALVLSMSSPSYAHSGPSSIKVEPKHQYRQHDRHQYNHQSHRSRYDDRYEKRHYAKKHYDKYYDRDKRHGYEHRYFRHDDRYDRHRHNRKQYYTYFDHDRRYRPADFIYSLPRGSAAVIINGREYYRWKNQHFLSGFYRGDKVFIAVDL